jgi:hypothetical protein
MLVTSNSVSRAKIVVSIKSPEVHIRSDRRHIQGCKTDHSYAEAHKGQSWMCQTRVFVGVR